MKNLLLPALFGLLILSSCTQQTLQNNKELFDFDWKFSLGDCPGAESPDFDDTKWKEIDLPHDYSIIQGFDSTNESGTGGGYTYGGIAWYRKHFLTDVSSITKKTYIIFNGIYRNSEVWLNGNYLGKWPYGYSSFYYDLSPYLSKPGVKNVIAVKVNTTEQPNSRWFTGSGIYRHVWIKKTDKLHFNQWGIFYNPVEANTKMGKIKTSMEIINENGEDKTYTIDLSVIDKNSKIVASLNSHHTIHKYDTAIIENLISVKNPVLWSIENPYLYTVIAEIKSENQICDREETKLGIRTFRFHPDSGFFLNNKHVKLKGTNNHHDGGMLGAACMDYTFERQLKILKEMGCNALRMSHNPPAPELLDCADSMGFVVIDEIFDEWVSGKTKAGYSPHFYEWYKKDVANWIRRDRNHPSVIAWSLGNEVGEQWNKEGVNILKLLKDEAKKYDVSRPFTSACNGIPTANEYGFAELLDIVGYNYRELLYEQDHKKYPERVIYGSETVIFPYHDGDDFPLRNYENWVSQFTSDYVAGEFLWTGFDYLGEASIGMGGSSYEPWNEWKQWPWRSAVCGVVDLCGFEKPGYYFRKALWSDEPVIYIATETAPSAKDPENTPFWGWPQVLCHWNHKKVGEILTVQVYTNIEKVELFLNDSSLGTKTYDINKAAYLTWDVAYKAGTLKAKGYLPDGGVKEFEVKTSGEPASIKLTTEKNTLKSNKQDITYVKVEIVDKKGIPVYFAGNDINFSIQGEGTLKAVGNADPTSPDSFHNNTAKAYQGKCLAIVQSGNKNGKIILKATSEGLQEGEITILVE